MTDAELLATDPARWLRWQLTQRGGLLWHECCATCQAWERDETDEGTGECRNRVGGCTHADDACSDYWPTRAAVEAHEGA